MAVARALSFELEGMNILSDMKARLLKEIIKTVPAENSSSAFFASQNQASFTLDLEFAKLLNIR